jgi:hypothetical protein
MVSLSKVREDIRVVREVPLQLWLPLFIICGVVGFAVLALSYAAAIAFGPVMLSLIWVAAILVVTLICIIYVR